MPTASSPKECVFREMFPQVDFTSRGPSAVPGPKDGECPLKTLRPGPRRPAWCHPERGPGWPGPKALPSLPSRAQATEEALMASEAPRGQGSWCGVGIARPGRGSGVISAAPRPRAGSRAQRLSRCGPWGSPAHPCLGKLLCSNSSDSVPAQPEKEKPRPFLPSWGQEAEDSPSTLQPHGISAPARLLQ